MSQVHFSRSGFHWLGPLLVAALLRQRGKVASHFLCLNAGLRIVPRERRRAQEKATRLHAGLDAFAEAASAGLKELDRLVMAKSQMERRLRNRRKSSSLPALIELVLARPVVSAGLIAAELKNGRAQLCRDTVRAGQADGAWPQIKEAGPAAGARSQESRCIKGRGDTYFRRSARENPGPSSRYSVLEKMAMCASHKLEAARLGRACARASTRLHWHDPGEAKSLEAWCAQPCRRIQPA
jgi:hypothetical protein